MTSLSQCVKLADWPTRQETDCSLQNGFQLTVGKKSGPLVLQPQGNTFSQQTVSDLRSRFFPSLSQVWNPTAVLPPTQPIYFTYLHTQQQTMYLKGNRNERKHRSALRTIQIYWAEDAAYVN
ncbi:hypothetical protein R6Z07F_014606 [Ovis aries]